MAPYHIGMGLFTFKSAYTYNNALIKWYNKSIDSAKKDK